MPVHKLDNKCHICRLDFLLSVDDIMSKLKQINLKNKDGNKIEIIEKLTRKLIESLEQIANRNNLKAQCNLGDIYFKSHWVKKI